MINDEYDSIKILAWNKLFSNNSYGVQESVVNIA